MDKAPKNKSWRAKPWRPAAGLIVAAALAAPAIANADPVTVTYSYDALGRVIEARQSTGQLTTYSYDKAGNRTSSSTTGGKSPAFVVLPLLGGLVLPIP
ncbi:MAG: RHS repeat protein [Caulobacter sp.]|jgi:YD repeat-containing protein|nr:RHS repeat protein [Caulobacter sp.]